MKQCASEWTEVYNGLEDQAMSSHKKVAEDVYRTEYENGVVFYVNYGDADVELSNGISVPAKGYLKTKIQ